MEKHITLTNTKAISRFLQLLDGSFPNGAFVHSFGLEPHIILEKVSDRLELKTFLENLIIDQYCNFDFVFIRNIYKYFTKNQLDLIIREDNFFSARLPYEYAKASQDIGENYLKQINFSITSSIVKKYFDSVANKHSKGNELCILSAYAYEIGLNVDTLLLFWAKKNIINIAMTSLKISKITPSQIQQTLFELDDILIDYINNTSKEIGIFNPLFEEIIHQHHKLEPKLFTT
ncbi:urease accessory protein UreF [Francisella sciaenopsi]|uniref:Urease accessory protein UreF n=1 Tax=Francisella sciaenopsi TaxID=3055034 RepID=A0ABQ6PEF4_9GAMM